MCVFILTAIFSFDVYIHTHIPTLRSTTAFHHHTIPGVTNTLILRMYKPDPFLNDTLRIDEIEPPVLYVGNTLNDGTRYVGIYTYMDDGTRCV